LFLQDNGGGRKRKREREREREGERRRQRAAISKAYISKRDIADIAEYRDTDIIPREFTHSRSYSRGDEDRDTRSV
jgi:hypothetical protein